jgi:hypothetical protein
MSHVSRLLIIVFTRHCQYKKHHSCFIPAKTKVHWTLGTVDWWEAGTDQAGGRNLANFTGDIVGKGRSVGTSRTANRFRSWRTCNVGVCYVCFLVEESNCGFNWHYIFSKTNACILIIENWINQNHEIITETVHTGSSTFLCSLFLRSRNSSQENQLAQWAQKFACRGTLDEERISTLESRTRHQLSLEPMHTGTNKFLCFFLRCTNRS